MKPFASILGALILAAASTASAHYGAHQTGAVFTITNESTGNRVVAFSRERDGTLSEAGAYPTGGRGTGDSLGSQGALVLTDSNRFLLAVDAGSDELSSFAVDGARLRLRSRVSSRGSRPVSVTERDGIVYVVNAGGDGNIAGFALDYFGRLYPIPGSVQPLGTPGSAPGQIAFSPDGRTLVVSEKAANELATYRVDRFGRAGAPDVFPSEGQTPFGFAITYRGDVVVSEAASGSASSYELTRDGDLEPITAELGAAQRAPCWVTLSRDHRIAYVANAGSASISAFEIDRHGALTLLDAVAGATGPASTPLDLALDRSGGTLYALDRGNRGILALTVERSGRLTPIGVTGALAPFATGIAAY